MTAETAYVFCDLYASDPMLVGKIQLDRERLGRFQYATSFLDSKRGFALDPLNLPLQPDVSDWMTKPWIPGVLLDAGPDDWGQRSLAYRGRDVGGLAALLAGSGSGVGCLLFSRSRDAVKSRPDPPELDQLRSLMSGVEAVEQGEPLPAHLAKLLDAGTSMGGARPKAVIRHDGTLWLAKFPSRADVLDQPASEAATLTLAGKAGIHVAEHRLIRVADRNVLLVKRFDVVASPTRGEGPRRHYVSMASLLTIGRRLRPDAVKSSQSYMAFANEIAAHGSRPRKDRHELFRRMVFNVLIGHVDDHSRNHGLLMPAAGGFALSPCFDIAPSNGNAESVGHLRERKSLGIGADGDLRSIRNLFSSVRDFDLDRDAASEIFEEVRHVVQGWRAVFDEAGVSPRDQHLVEVRILNPDLGFGDVPKRA